MSRPTILMTASTLPRWQGDYEPDFILQLASALGEGCDVTVLAPHTRDSRVDETLDGVRIHRFRYAPAAWENLAYEGGMLHKLKTRPLRWLLVPGFILAQLVAILRLHRERHFDILHAHWIVPQGLVAAFLKSLGFFRGPVLLSSHGGDLFSLQGRLFTPLKKWVLSRVDHVNVVSRAMVPHCVALGAPAENITVRSMGVDTSHRFNCQTPASQRSGLVFVGRLVEKKGVNVLLRAFARVHRMRPGQTLTLVGEGPLRAELEALARSLECDTAVSFRGAVPNAEVPGLLMHSSIAVVPSVVAKDGDQEGLGLVAVEAMGCGCAVVCSSLPALRDVVEPAVTGVMFEPGDDESLAQAILELLADTNRLDRLAAAGRHAVRTKFDWTAVAADFGRIYAALLDRPTDGAMRPEKL